MTPQHAHDGRNSRYGTCHRCGWRGQVAKFTLRERRGLPGDRTFARLCDDCVNDFLHARPRAATETESSRLQSVGNRDVA